MVKDTCADIFRYLFDNRDAFGLRQTVLGGITPLQHAFTCQPDDLAEDNPYQTICIPQRSKTERSVHIGCVGAYCVVYFISSLLLAAGALRTA